MFKINNEEWRIIAVPSNDIALKRSDGGYTIGVCDDNYKCIYIANNLPDTLLKKVLCHEITHAAMFSYDVTLSLE